MISVHALLIALAGATVQDPPEPERWWAYLREHVGQPVRYEVREGGLSLYPPELWYFSLPERADDADGDGVDDLRIVGAQRMFCGHDTPFGFVRILSVLRRARITHIGGDANYRVAVTPNATFVRCEGQYLRSTLERRTALDGDVLWSVDETGSPIGTPRTTCSVGDADGDGVADVAIGNAWARVELSVPPEPGEDRSLGAVCMLSGDDGSALWTRWGTELSEGVGMDLAAAGDYDGDGVTDLAVLVSSPSAEHAPNRVDILDGRTGDTLHSVEIGGRPLTIRSAGDLDGDGLLEWLIEEKSQSVLSLRTGTYIDICEGEPCAWVAPAGDLDGDGIDDLLVGRERPFPIGRSISVFSRTGLRHHASVPSSEPPWIRARALTGDFDGDGLLDLAILNGIRSSTFLSGNELRIVFGSHLR